MFQNFKMMPSESKLEIDLLLCVLFYDTFISLYGLV